ncbi:ubiquitin carboxyl-terminal hydrolase 10-A-like isoform X2 [Prorops nasuta]|uniref:ubiquitin carboxyl-terminal hydrolase 10-A-like isoform X2 n=1 Tax=Prorops nasuta TaxID=863751 RepID=UPI0034CED96E
MNQRMDFENKLDLEFLDLQDLGDNDKSEIISILNSNVVSSSMKLPWELKEANSNTNSDNFEDPNLQNHWHQNDTEETYINCNNPTDTMTSIYMSPMSVSPVYPQQIISPVCNDWQQSIYMNNVPTDQHVASFVHNISYTHSGFNMGGEMHEASFVRENGRRGAPRRTLRRDNFNQNMNTSNEMQSGYLGEQGQYHAQMPPLMYIYPLPEQTMPSPQQTIFYPPIYPINTAHPHSQSAYPVHQPPLSNIRYNRQSQVAPQHNHESTKVPFQKQHEKRIQNNYISNKPFSNQVNEEDSNSSHTNITTKVTVNNNKLDNCMVENYTTEETAANKKNVRNHNKAPVNVKIELNIKSTTNEISSRTKNNDASSLNINSSVEVKQNGETDQDPLEETVSSLKINLVQEPSQPTFKVAEKNLSKDTIEVDTEIEENNTKTKDKTTKDGYSIKLNENVKIGEKPVKVEEKILKAEDKIIEIGEKTVKSEDKTPKAEDKTAKVEEKIEAINRKSSTIPIANSKSPELLQAQYPELKQAQALPLPIQVPTPLPTQLPPTSQVQTPAPQKTWASLLKKDVPTARVTPLPTNTQQTAQISTPNGQCNRASVRGKIEKPEQLKNDPMAYKIGELLTKYQMKKEALSLMPRGLTNRSNYCYINSILQALLACPPFYKLFLALPRPQDASKNSPTPLIDNMIDFVHEFPPLVEDNKLPKKEKKRTQDLVATIQSGSAFEPISVYRVLRHTVAAGHFSIEGRQEDAEEFLSCLLNGINDEMLELMKLVGDDQNTNNTSNSEDEEDEWKVMGPKKKGSVTRCTVFGRTPLSDIFRGQLRSTVFRAGEESTDNVQPFFTLQLDIQNAESVKAAFEIFVGKDELEGIKCSKTKKQIEAWKQVTLEELPVVLILHLKFYNNGCAKLFKSIDFPVDLKLESYCLSANATKRASSKKMYNQYKLFAVTYHDGKETSKGHYVTDAYHGGFGGWIRYDDSSVKAVSEKNVLKPTLPRVPYLLYYRRCDTINNNQSNNSKTQ